MAKTEPSEGAALSVSGVLRKVEHLVRYASAMIMSGLGVTTALAFELPHTWAIVAGVTAGCCFPSSWQIR